MVEFDVNETIMDNLDKVLQKFFHNETHLKQKIIISIRNNCAINKSQTEIFYINIILQNQIFNDYFSSIVDEFFNVFLTISDFRNEINDFKSSFIANYILPMQELCLNTLKKQVIRTPMVVNVLQNYISNIFQRNHVSKTEQDIVILLNKTYDDSNQDYDFNNFTNESYKLFIQKSINKYLDKTIEHTHIDDVSIPSSENIFKQKFISKHEREPNIFEVSEFSAFVHDFGKLADIYLCSLDIDFSINFEKIIYAFKTIFEREITVHEYRRYYKACNVADPLNVFSEYKRLYTSKFYICENIYKQYTEESLNFQIFTNTFLPYIDLEDNKFIEKTVDIIINDTLYDVKMKSLISKQYFTLFSTELETYNLKYYFQVVHKRKYHLVDERIGKTVSDLNDDTQADINTINEIFERILLRASDTYENEKYLMYFRDPNNVSPTNNIENELYTSLEYQDVLKEWIHKSVRIKNRSVVFKILAYIQQSFDEQEIRNLDELLVKLKQQFNEYF